MNTMILKSGFSLIMLVSSLVVFGQTTTTNTGDWNSTGTWTSGIPGAGSSNVRVLHPVLFPSSNINSTFDQGISGKVWAVSSPYNTAHYSSTTGLYIMGTSQSPANFYFGRTSPTPVLPDWSGSNISSAITLYDTLKFTGLGFGLSNNPLLPGALIQTARGFGKTLPNQTYFNGLLGIAKTKLSSTSLTLGDGLGDLNSTYDLPWDQFGTTNPTPEPYSSSVILDMEGGQYHDLYVEDYANVVLERGITNFEGGAYINKNSVLTVKSGATLVLGPLKCAVCDILNTTNYNQDRCFQANLASSRTVSVTTGFTSSFASGTNCSPRCGYTLTNPLNTGNISGQEILTIYNGNSTPKYDVARIELTGKGFPSGSQAFLQGYNGTTWVDLSGKINLPTGTNLSTIFFDNKSSNTFMSFYRIVGFGNYNIASNSATINSINLYLPDCRMERLVTNNQGARLEVEAGGRVIVYGNAYLGNNGSNNVDLLLNGALVVYGNFTSGANNVAVTGTGDLYTSGFISQPSSGTGSIFGNTTSCPSDCQASVNTSCADGYSLTLSPIGSQTYCSDASTSPFSGQVDYISPPNTSFGASSKYYFRLQYFNPTSSQWVTVTNFSPITSVVCNTCISSPQELAITTSASNGIITIQASDVGQGKRTVNAFTVNFSFNVPSNTDLGLANSALSFRLNSSAASGFTGCALTSGIATVFYNVPGKTWLGKSTSWFSTSNWCGGSLPTLTDDVVISTIASGIYPTIDANASAEAYAKSLYISARPTISNSAALTLTQQNLNLGSMENFADLSACSTCQGIILSPANSKLPKLIVTGSLISRSAIRINPDATLEVSGGLDNYSTLTNGGNAKMGSLANYGTFTNYTTSPGTLEVLGDMRNFQSSTFKFDLNASTVKVSGDLNNTGAFIGRTVSVIGKLTFLPSDASSSGSILNSAPDVNSSFQVGDVEVISGFSLSIPASGSGKISIGGNLTNNGILNVNEDLYFSGSNLQTITPGINNSFEGNIFMDQVSESPKLTIQNNPLNLFGRLGFIGTRADNTDAIGEIASAGGGTLVLKSVSVNTYNGVGLTGSIAPIPDAVKITSNVTFERYINATGKTLYRNFGIPLQSTPTIQLTDDFVYRADYSWLLDETAPLSSNGRWRSVTGGALAPGRGYQFWTPNAAAITIDATGLLASGSATVSLPNPNAYTRTFVFPELTFSPSRRIPIDYPTPYLPNGVHFLANPFPAPIVWHNANWTVQNFDGTGSLIPLANPAVAASANYVFPKAYAYNYNSTGALSIRTIDPGTSIPSGQAFIVRVPSTRTNLYSYADWTAGKASVRLIVNEKAKADFNTDAVFSRSIDSRRPGLLVKFSNDTYADEAELYDLLADNSPVVHEEKLDLLPLQVYFRGIKGRTSRNAAASFNDDEMLIPIILEVDASGRYSMSFEPIKGEEELSGLYLNDLAENVSYPIEAGKDIYFLVDRKKEGKVIDNRFYISKRELPMEVDDAKMVSVFPNPAIDFLFVKGLGDVSNSRVSIFDLSGKEVLNTHSDGDGMVNISSLPRGLYLIELMVSGKLTSLKFVKI